MHGSVTVVINPFKTVQVVKIVKTVVEYRLVETDDVETALNNYNREGWLIGRSLSLEEATIQDSRNSIPRRMHVNAMIDIFFSQFKNPQ
jgi:hypothetical protein